ncbi:MAG: tRNA (N6-isopentenyl adenosine(37)-C2)-methylthiotransferase MiaB [Planctomycetota bacterium]|nr:tRNA (N6-isopentenyl adenosine(37)-C2)-methylthiotransferase MiaB [Planctomycetota bacterium]
MTEENPVRVCIVTFGCQMNDYDSGRIAGMLRDRGADLVEDPKKADFIIVNTCSVRRHAEDRVLSLLGKLRAWRRRDPARRLVVAGCMAEREAGSIAGRFPHVDFLVGARRITEIGRLYDAVSSGRPAARGGPLVAVGDAPGGDGVDFGDAPAVRPIAHQACVAVSRGCNRRCSYCVVPSARGPEKSRTAEDIEEEARRLAADGVREITLLGQTIDSYGRDLGDGTSLESLLRRLYGIPGLLRLRFITNHPANCRESLFRTMAELSDKVMPFIHMPAQSGSDRILKLMRRGYTREKYLRLLDAARRLCPGIGIASDFIAGFPTESRADFEDTLDLVRRAGFQSCFLFKYSPRPGTEAAGMPDDVPEAEKKARHAELAALQAGISERLNRERIGCVEEVLVDSPSKTDPGRLTGRSRSFRIVIFPGGPDLIGSLVRVKIEKATALALYGSLVR